MRSNLISANTSNEGDRNRQAGGILFREVQYVVEFFAAGTGAELFEPLAEILQQVCALVFVNRPADILLSRIPVDSRRGVTDAKARGATGERKMR